MPLILGSDDADTPYFYSVINLRAGPGREILVCATRKDGVAALEFEGDKETYSLSTITFKGLDVVDVCALNPAADSLSVAALGRDGTLGLFRDVLVDKRPVTLKFGAVHGMAYRVLCCKGDIYVLTSKGIFVLGKLAERFLAGELSSGTITPVLPLPMDAVDACLAHDRWLLVVMADEVRKFDVELIHQSIPQILANGTASHTEMQDSQKILTRDWKRHGLQQRSRQLAGVTKSSA
jgi:hypothetical protein